MKKSIISLVLLISVFFSGCSVFDGQYVRITPHEVQSASSEDEAYYAEMYSEIRDALVDMVSEGKERGVIYTSGFEYDGLERAMGIAKQYVRMDDPIGAFCIEDITSQVGTNSGRMAAAVEIKYRRSFAETNRIRKFSDIQETEEYLLSVLSNYNSNAVFLIQNYDATDFAQLIKDMAERYPQYIMENPQVREELYGRGNIRVVELFFDYENSRDSLRQMQMQVGPIFDAAALYVSGEGSDRQKLSQLYAFLMERFDYTQETSITPAYSLLRHGVGDSRAFATVYAAMCRKAGLECLTVTGTRWGESWTWNMVCDDDMYYHVDLLRCNAENGFYEMPDNGMNGYVWDYSAYPQGNIESAESSAEKK